MADVDDVRRAWGRTRPTGEGHRVTTFELFFDLVYVFAITQVTGHLAHEHSLHGIVQGLLMLALLWWTWAGYTWLGNQARADEGLLRAGMAIAMAAMFVVSLTIPEAWHDMPGGLEGPVVFVGAYFLVRAIHLAVYTVAAAEAHDSGLRHQLAITWVPACGGQQPLQHGHRRLPPARLDRRHGRLRHVGRPREVTLRHATPATRGGQRTSVIFTGRRCLREASQASAT